MQPETRPRLETVLPKNFPTVTGDPVYGANDKLDNFRGQEIAEADPHPSRLDALETVEDISLEAR